MKKRTKKLLTGIAFNLLIIWMCYAAVYLREPVPRNLFLFTSGLTAFVAIALMFRPPADPVKRVLPLSLLLFFNCILIVMCAAKGEFLPAVAWVLDYAHVNQMQEET